MSNWGQKDLHKHMHVYASDNTNLGHIAAIYEDSFLIHKGIFLPKDRYIPYSAIMQIENDHVTLNMNAAEAQEIQWEIRPDYNEHLGDPTQLMYDRSHEVHDPFDDTTAEKS